MRITLVGPVPIRDASTLLDKDSEDYFKLFANDRGVSVLITAKALLQRGHKVTVITTDKNTEKIEVFENGNFRLIIVPRRKKLKPQVADFYKRERLLITRIIDGESSQIVNAQWTYEYALAALDSSKPCIITVHDAPISIFFKFRDVLRFFHLLIAARVRLRNPDLIFVSPFIATKWRKEMIWTKKIIVVPNIALTTKVPEKETREYMKCISVTESGRLKNSSTLIKSWPKVIEKCPDAVLFLVGHGMQQGGDLQRWASKRGLDKRIEWVGFLDHDEAIGEISSSKLLISTSRQESFGLTLLEAMSLGVPVVAGIKSGATSWVLGKSGLLVNVKRPEEISSAIITILTDENLRARFATEGLNRTKSEFSDFVVCEHLEEIYSTYALTE